MGHFGQPGREEGQFLFDGLQLRKGGHHLGKELSSLGDDAILGEIADGSTFGKLQFAACVFHLAGDDAHQRGFSRSVLANQADPLPLLQVPVDLGKKRLTRKIF